MIGPLKRLWDGFRGSGDAAVTVPPMDGALRPNQLLETARLVAAVPSPDDLASDGRSLFVSSGPRILRLVDGVGTVTAEFGAEITALAASPRGRMAAAVASDHLVVTEPDGASTTIARLGDGPMRCITALTFAGEGALLIAQGSSQRAAAGWKRDLMERRSDGAVWRLDLATRQAERLAGGLGWPLGLALDAAGGILVAESWKHRIVALAPGRAPRPVLADLPGYPARLHPDPAGGTWLALFAPRNQLIEFVQREPVFLARMFAEVDEAHWAAPSLRPSATFLEPLQGGAQKHLGMLKPWAPTRSYGLIVRLDDALRPVASYHSRADGMRHGVFTCLPFGGRILAAAKGGDAVVEIDPAADPANGPAAATGAQP
ncbi:strictosidine synthase [Prosthecomicrobium hirschii]|uniref:strictosidine synthase n=1 Tax=Prosthecodimorpha hirschii TaxID=665126 RepID=UPI00222109F4|nr:strictosidine synthase [Prosthecomicrobium hirschii]MCW1843349.1 strictosidine synthase [Prosthecomicrobium hirschii]